MSAGSKIRLGDHPLYPRVERVMKLGDHWWGLAKTVEGFGVPAGLVDPLSQYAMRRACEAYMTASKLLREIYVDIKEIEARL